MNLPKDNLKNGLRTSLRRGLVVCAVMLAGVTTSGCSIYVDETLPYFKRIFSKDTFKLYRNDIVQGNVLDWKTIEKVKLGASKEQVHFLLGDPILPTLFHENRWDYVYYIDSLYEQNKYYSISLFFDDDKVTRIKRVRDARAAK